MPFPTVQTYEKFSHEVIVKIYKRMQSDHKGEMTEDHFYGLVEDIIQKELEGAISIMYDSEVDILLCEHYIVGAIAFYRWNKKDYPTIRIYLYIILDTLISNAITHEDYLKWCDTCE